MPRPYERREIFVGATHGSPFIRRRHAERGRGMPRPYERTDLRRGDPRGRPSSAGGMLKEGNAPDSRRRLQRPLTQVGHIAPIRHTGTGVVYE
jgi:hypothetical protein